MSAHLSANVKTTDLVQAYIYLRISLSLYLQIYKTGMIAMLSNPLIQRHDVNRWTCHIAMKVVSKDFSCSMVGWGARAACAEVSTGSVEASKAKHGQMDLQGPYVPWYIRKNYIISKLCGNDCVQRFVMVCLTVLVMSVETR
jgi:hypothetical protein